MTIYIEDNINPSYIKQTNMDGLNFLVENDHVRINPDVPSL